MKKGKNTRLAAVVAIAVAFFLLPIKLAAQNNKAGIDDEVYDLYLQADKHRQTEQGLKLSEQAYKLAVKKGDKKGQSMALCLQIFYYYKRRDTDGLKKIIDRIMDVSKRNGQTKYYYFSWSKWIEYNINERKLLLALQEAQKLNETLLSNHSNDYYDIATSYKVLANIYWSRCDFDQAANYYQKTLDYYNKYLPKQDATYIYIMLAECRLKKKNYKHALEILNVASEKNSHKRMLSTIYSKEATVYFYLNDKKRFIDAYNKMNAAESKYGHNDNHEGDGVEVMRHLLNGDVNKARKKTEEIIFDEVRIECQRLIALAENNSKSVYDLSDDILDMYLEDFTKISSGDMAEMNKSIDEIQFKADNLELQLQLANSKRTKDILEKEKILAREKMKDLLIANNALKLNETRAADSLNKSKLAFQAQTLAAEKDKVRQEGEAHKLHITIFALLLTFMLTLLVNELLNRKKANKLIVELRDSNNALEEAKEKAEESSRMKSMFVQNVSHEIRTPLNAIVGFCDLLLNPDMELADEEKAEFGKIIHQNSDLLTGLVNDVLVLSELQSGKATVNIAPCKCNALCRQSIDTVLHRKPEGVTLDFTTDVDDDFTINTDLRRAKQVIINFLTNAEKYTSQGSITLACSTREKPGCVVFSVIDTGCGIPPEKQEQIFGRFEKLDDFHQGMGLGLNICSYIAELLNAKIGIDKSYTQGARFYFAIDI